jgi:hypothetical protein
LRLITILLKKLTLHGTLIPHPLLPQEKGSKTIIFLFPSPAGEGLGVRALYQNTKKRQQMI